MTYLKEHTGLQIYITTKEITHLMYMEDIDVFEKDEKKMETGYK